MYNLLYKSFPRQIAMPWRKNVDKEEFYNLINKYNGVKRLFASIYNFTKDGDRNDMIIDKIFFDFDGDEALNEVRTLSAYLRRENYKHLLLFSGGGFHIYLFTSEYDKLNNKKVALLNAHRYIKEKANITFDRAIIGDIARVATIPNTWNTKRKRFCIPLTIEELSMSYDEIKDKAQNQQFNFVVYGDNYFNIKKFDSEFSDSSIPPTNVCTSTDIKLKFNNDNLLKRMPPCISKLLYEGQTERIGWRSRYLLIVYLRDYGMFYPVIVKILNTYLKTEKRGITEAEHCIKEENQFDYLINQYNCTFPKCEQLKQEGYCPINDFCEYTQKRDNNHLVKIYR